MFSGSRGDLFGVESNKRNDEITSYIQALINNLNIKDSSTKDVVMLRLSTFLFTEQKFQLDDYFQDIYKSIPATVAVHSPSLNKKVWNRKLRPAAFVIMVMDESSSVSFNR